MNSTDYEYRLLYHCAPTIYGIKSANLFSLQNVSDNEFKKIFAHYSHVLNCKGLKIRIMCRCTKNVLFYVYNEELLKTQLQKSSIITFLKENGYNDFSSVDRILNRLHVRIKQNSSFPHEIGIFLDYPLVDVKGFIKNKGQKFLYNGCWKVYGEVDSSIRLFELYDKCRDDVCQKLKQGLSANEVLLSA